MPTALPQLEAKRAFDVPLRAAAPTTLQINIGLLCNLACAHCHVDSSPQRRSDAENMSGETADRIIDWVRRHDTIATVDITGGSPEMNPHFRRMVEAFRAAGRRVIDRCNPTIIGHTDRRTGATYDWIPAFLAAHRVEVTASLPCYLEDNVEAQRGDGSYDASIAGLLALNAAGYGTDPELELNLVYNPVGPSLPPPQVALEADYRRELEARFGIRFTRLWTITNMPIKRFRRDLERGGNLHAYLDRLVDAYNAETIDGLMCRHQIHCDSQGRLSDCDFNFALGMPTPAFRDVRLWDVTPQQLTDRRIATADHCFGCTAGAGSSCTGAIE